VASVQPTNDGNRQAGEQVLLCSLVAARKAKKLQAKDIAHLLKLPEHVVLQLEAEDFEKLGGEFFVKRYIQAYADAVDVAVEPILEAYQFAINTQPVEVDESDEPSVFSMQNAQTQHRHHKTGLGLLAASVVALFGVILLPSSEQPLELPVTAKPVPAMVIDTAMGTTTIESFDVLPAANPTESLVPELSVQTLEQSTLSSNLSFSFSADCWVEVYDGDDKRIFASLKRADETLDLQGKPPFRVTLGYAPGVSVSYNGQPVEVEAKHSSSSMAKLVLGNS